eukprot:6492157-Amphidinium_carterae.2
MPDTSGELDIPLAETIPSALVDADGMVTHLASAPGRMVHMLSEHGLEGKFMHDHGDLEWQCVELPSAGGRMSTQVPRELVDKARKEEPRVFEEM